MGMHRQHRRHNRRISHALETCASMVGTDNRFKSLSILRNPENPHGDLVCSRSRNARPARGSVAHMELPQGAASSCPAGAVEMRGGCYDQNDVTELVRTCESIYPIDDECLVGWNGILLSQPCTTTLEQQQGCIDQHLA